jgi:arylsulfatase A
MRQTLLAIATVTALAVGPASAADRPNIVLIFADDIGIGGFGCYGSDDYKSPHLDALAQGGLRFESCYSMGLCGPSRACLLTGRYAFRTGMVYNNTGRKVTPDREVCVARVLRDAGYATAFAGKWNQLSYLTSPADAARWGWDEYLMWQSGDSDGRYWKPNYVKNGKRVEGVEDAYGPDLLHNYAADFIARHKDRPFFLYYPTPLVHGPLLRTPDSAADSKRPRVDMVAYLDKLVARLVAELDRHQLRERTVVIFTSDNGTPTVDKVRGRPLHGTKNTLQEGGSRVPLIVRWPGTVKPGRVCTDLIDFSDFFPTLIELAGAKPPAGVTLDGQSFAAQLRGQPGRPREWVYVQLQDERYVRDARWKLYGDGTLCDMKDAPFGETPVKDGGADATAARRRLQAVLDRLK